MFFPIFTNLKPLKEFFCQFSEEHFIGFTAIILLLITFSSKRLHDLWRRYKNTHKLAKPPFVYFDGIFLFFSFTILLIVLFQRKSIPDLSSEFKSFLIINTILIVGWLLSSYFWKERENETKSRKIESFPLSDEPIQFPEQDLLGREKFIEDLYKEITYLPFTDSFVFGLYGSWGEGKTSVINLLRDKFKDNKDFLIVNFDPWHYKDEEAILNAFYEQVEKAISQKFIFSGLKKTFVKYQKATRSGLSYAGINLNFEFGNETLDMIKQRIEDYICKTKMKILIFIDDIDRLQPAEMSLVFKLVRLNTKFKNTIILLSFDPIKVQNCLKTSLNPETEFLEKIVQKPIPLPAIEQAVIDNFLDVHLDKIFNEIKVAERVTAELKEFSYIYQTQIRKLFTTLRNVKRYLNSLRSTLPPIKYEINLYDLLILEVINVFYPKIYRDIWRQFWFYIPLKWSDATFHLDPFLKDDVKYKQIREHIEAIIVDEKEPQVLKELLQTIFFVEVKNALSMSRTEYGESGRHFRAEKRITHPDCFKKYFMRQVLPREISDEFVNTTLSNWYSAKSEHVENTIESTLWEFQQSDEKLLEFLKKLSVFRDELKQEIVGDVVRVTYRNINKFSKKGTENFWNSEYDKAEMLLMALINERIEKLKIQEILEEVVINTPYIPFGVTVVMYCNKERSGSFYNIYDSTDYPKLRNVCSERLKKYFIDEGRDIFDEFKEANEWSFILYQWGTNWGTFEGDNNKIVNDHVFSLIKDDAKKFIKFLLHWKETTFPQETRVFNLDKFGKIYNLLELRDIANKFKDDELLTIEEKAEIRMFLELLDKKLEAENKSHSEGKIP